jgi:hypothetical protein
MSLLIVGFMILAVLPYFYLIALPMVVEQKLKHLALNWVYVERAYKVTWYDDQEKVLWIAEDGDIFNNIYAYIAAIHIESGMSFEQILDKIKAGTIAKWILMARK